MPSIEEGLGTAVLDAFLFSLPVVGTRAGGIPEMIEDGINGLLVEPGDPRALADAVVRLLKNPELSHTLGRTAGETVRAKFTYTATVQKTIEIYKEVLGT